MAKVTLHNTLCPWCNSGHVNPDKESFENVNNKLRPITHYSCGTKVARFYSKGKNRAEWLKTCRLSSQPSFTS